MVAVNACQEFKVRSPNDREALDNAKELAYMKGFYDGKMLVGEFRDQPVKVAKPLIRDYLIKISQAVQYAEPAQAVVSRSGDECVVSLTDQWYLDYGEPTWRSQVEQ
jgi:leucyl-tRNA synthetase